MLRPLFHQPLPGLRSSALSQSQVAAAGLTRGISATQCAAQRLRQYSSRPSKYSDHKPNQVRRSPSREPQYAKRAPKPEQEPQSRQILLGASNFWLRDACPCPQCVDPDSGQKSFASTQLPHKSWWKKVHYDKDGSLHVVWSNDPLSGGKDHESVYPASMLPTPSIPERPSDTRMIRRDLWDRQDFEKGLDSCRVSYADWVAGGKEFWQAMAQLATKGLVFVYDVPQDEKSVERLGEKIGSLQETFYGRTWDVVSKPQAENVAYTNKFLGLHQDLLYYPDTPRIQLLHCLDNDADGGESLFSDGVYAATRLFWNEGFRKGSRGYVNHPIPGALLHNKFRFGYNKNGNVYSREHNLAKVVTTLKGVPLVESVWWSPPFQIPFAAKDADFPLYKAAKAFQHTLEHEKNVFEYKMKAGECVVFDNWRVLHGRNHFNTASGKRWLKGTYVADSVYTARFDDMPQDIAKEHGVFTELEKEAYANLEHAQTHPDSRAIFDAFHEAYRAEISASAHPPSTVKDDQDI